MQKRFFHIEEITTVSSHMGKMTRSQMTFLGIRSVLLCNIMVKNLVRKKLVNENCQHIIIQKLLYILFILGCRLLEECNFSTLSFLASLLRHKKGEKDQVCVLFLFFQFSNYTIKPTKKQSSRWKMTLFPAS